MKLGGGSLSRCTAYFSLLQPLSLISVWLTFTLRYMIISAGFTFGGDYFDFFKFYQIQNTLSAARLVGGGHHHITDRPRPSFHHRHLPLLRMVQAQTGDINLNSDQRNCHKYDHCLPSDINVTIVSFRPQSSLVFYTREPSCYSR